MFNPGNDGVDKKNQNQTFKILFWESTESSLQPTRRSVPAAELVGVVFSLGGILLKVFLTAVGEALGLGHGLPDGDCVGVVPFL